MAQQTNRKRAGLFDHDGNRIVTVKTILGKFQDPTALMNWAWKLGAAGRSLQEGRDEQNTLGHLSAARALAFITGQAFIAGEWPAEMVAATDRPFAAFSAWAIGVDLKIIASEKPLVSGIHGFGGYVTVAQITGQPYIFSLKAGRGVYLEDLLTAAAYATLWQQSVKDTSPAGAHFIRFGKDEGGFDECKPIADLQVAWKMFLSLFAAYKSMRSVEDLLSKGAA